MLKPNLWMSCVTLLALAIGPLSFLASHSGRADDGDVYIVFEIGSSTRLTKEISSAGAWEIGPKRPPMSRMIQASTAPHAQLKQAGYVMIPASALAALCGIELTKAHQTPRI